MVAEFHTAEMGYCAWNSLTEIGAAYLSRSGLLTDELDAILKLTPRFAVPDKGVGGGEYVGIVDDIRPSAINSTVPTNDTASTDSLDVFLRLIDICKK